MELHVFLAVLAAALCHAGWNAGLKMRIDPVLSVTILAVAAGAVSVPLLPITGFPGPNSWGYLVASVIIHVFYFRALAEGYRTGDLGQVYPIARGTAPLLTMLGSMTILGEELGAMAMVGIVLLMCGVLLLSLPVGGKAAGYSARAVVFALITAGIIATYTLIDGRGAQVAGSPHAYAVAFFIGNGLAMGLIGVLTQRDALFSAMRETGLAMQLGAGVLSFVSYWVALWAMTKAPIALVAALRETSVLFAALLGVVLLKEAVVPARIAAAFLVMSGLALMRLA